MIDFGSRYAWARSFEVPNAVNTIAALDDIKHELPAADERFLYSDNGPEFVNK